MTMRCASAAVVRASQHASERDAVARLLRLWDVNTAIIAHDARSVDVMRMIVDYADVPVACAVVHETADVESVHIIADDVVRCRMTRVDALRAFVHAGQQAVLLAVHVHHGVWLFTRDIDCEDAREFSACEFGACGCEGARQHRLFFDVLSCVLQRIAHNLPATRRNAMRELINTLFRVDTDAVKALAHTLSSPNQAFLQFVWTRSRLTSLPTVEEERAWLSTTMQDFDEHDRPPYALELMAQLTRRIFNECNVAITTVIQPAGTHSVLHVLVPHTNADYVCFVWTVGGLSAEDIDDARARALEAVRADPKDGETTGANIVSVACWYTFNKRAGRKVLAVAPLFAHIVIYPRHNPFGKATLCTATYSLHDMAHDIGTHLAQSFAVKEAPLTVS